MARSVFTCSILLLPVLLTAVQPRASAQPAGLIPNAVPPQMQAPPPGPPQVYPHTGGWPQPERPYQTPHWPATDDPRRAARGLAAFTPQPAQYPVSPHGEPATRVFTAAETVARVGDQHIFRGDLVGEANLILAPLLEKLPPEEIEKNRRDIETQREQIVEKLLPGAIDRKLMFLEFLRSIPSEKREEVLGKIDTNVGSALEEAVLSMLEKVQAADPEGQQDLARQDSQLFRLAYAMQQHNMTSLRQLEAYLRSYGSSLEKQRQTFAERSLGQQQMRKSINIDPDVTHQEMVEYYRSENQEFQVPPRARWQQLTIRFDRVADKFAAGSAIAEMGNQLVLGGKQFWAVAKEKSHGPRAQDGGFHDWTEWGDLEVSREINKAVFSLPIDQLSGIIEDAEGLHIIRVLERHDAHAVPFREAQVDIKAKIQARKRTEALAEFLQRLRQQTPVSTIYDDPQGAQRIAEPPGSRRDGFPR